ncbi:MULTISPECIES: hypothetical protein [unclassified Devosia]|uniref:hypothetical protein n=1 Tax=unclassified Devosia TaxID=196773 RepID=UPI001AD3B3AA|nr:MULTISPECIES: hypothetical protein [unclassified Devosia]MBN9306300.1 hypothetical protein [Devosia sp.]
MEATKEDGNMAHRWLLVPFAAATLAVAGLMAFLTVVVIARGLALAGYPEWLGLFLIWGPIAWVVIVAGAFAVVGKRARFLLISLPFAFGPWICIALAFVSLPFLCLFSSCSL